ncbi:MAG: NAD-dependent epimerase/dehydratase family protein [Deltaproteobacteria bacterium]|nr:NAD-dependent epimerase/dehydratase family protein [Deltaproteobacteria bacterium]
MANKKRSVLVTGVSHYWGGRLASLLEEDQEVGTLIGIDYKKPEQKFKKLEFFQIEPHHPLLAELLTVAEVDTICHLLFVDAYRPSEEIFDLNVMGFMDLLAAAAAGQTPRVVIMSDTRVYGAHPKKPNFLLEHTELAQSASHPYVSDRIEIEKFADRFSRTNDKPELTILRFANILGHKADTPMKRYLAPPAAPTAFGFDPMFQLTHEEDVLAALLHALKTDVSGAFNIAGDGVMPLTQILRIGDRVPLPVGVPVIKIGGFLTRKTCFPDSLPIASDYLKFPCVGETVKMKEVLGFTPKYSTRQTAEDFYENMRLSRYLPRPAGIESDPQASEQLEEYIQTRRREAGYLFELMQEIEDHGQEQ